MSKSSKKRSLPKFSKFGKYFKLKRSSKKKKNDQDRTADQNGGSSCPTTPTCMPEYTELPSHIIEECDGDVPKNLQKDMRDTEEQRISEIIDGKDDSCEDFKSEKASTDSDVHVANGDSSQQEQQEDDSEVIADIVVHSSLEKDLNCKQIVDSEIGTVATQEKICQNTESVSKPNNLQIDTEQAEEYPEELIYPVLVKTPFQKQKSDVEIEVFESDDALKKEDITVLSNGRPIHCNVVVHTPVKKQLNGDTIQPVTKATTSDDDDDIILMEMPQTPPPKQPERKDCRRVSTVKKIRSIMATPYKRLKRDSSSLIDGHTYRYIEIQSLVNAFQTLHSCKGSMMACNEKGLQYGKSSVLRIECKDCGTKVFLQATKN